MTVPIKNYEDEKKHFSALSEIKINNFDELC